MSKGVTKPALLTAHLPLAGATTISDSKPIADAKDDKPKAGDKAEGDKPKAGDNAEDDDKSKAGDKAEDDDKPKAGGKLAAKGGDDCVLPKTGASTDSSELLLLGLALVGGGAVVVASRRFANAR